MQHEPQPPPPPLSVMLRRRRPARSFLSRGRFAKKCLADSSLLLSNSSAGGDALLRSFSSSALSFSSSALSSPPGSPVAAAASACYVPVPVSAAAAAELEHELLLASSRSNASFVDDAALVARARAARRQVESAAKRQALVGRWKQRIVPAGGAARAQVHECLSSAKDQFSVVAKLNLPCSLHEIQSALGADSAPLSTAAFHRSMAMLFGDQYVYGVHARSVDCAAYRRSSAVGSGLRSRGRSRSSSASASSWSHHSHSHSQQQQHPSLGSVSRLSVNAVSLLMRRRLVWRQRSMSFLDFSDERPDAKTVTRVLQTLDAAGDDDDDDDAHEATGADEEASAVTATAAAAASQTRSRPRPSALQRHESRARAPALRGILAGYVLQEDSAEKFTRLFFYGAHSVPPRRGKRDKREATVAAASVQLLRGVVRKLCALEAVVRRRRLGFYPLVPAPSDATALLQTAAACCSSCYAPFHALFRTKHFCHLCGHFSCRSCSALEPIEKLLGVVELRRVCVGCTRRVGYCVFDMHAGDAFYSEQQQALTKPQSLPSRQKLADVPEEDFPPLLGDDDDDLAATVIEDLALFPGDADTAHAHALAADQVAKYIKGMFERNGGPPFFSPQPPPATPQDTTCLLDSTADARFA